MNVLVADTGGFEFVADPDDMTVYVNHTLDVHAFAAAVARGTLALYAGIEAVPGARRLGGHLRLVPAFTGRAASGSRPTPG